MWRDDSRHEGNIMNKLKQQVKLLNATPFRQVARDSYYFNNLNGDISGVIKELKKIEEQASNDTQDGSDTANVQIQKAKKIQNRLNILGDKLKKMGLNWVNSTIKEAQG